MPDRLSRLSEQDLHVALVLTLTLATGAVDAVSYFSLDHVFTANMSGNIALLGVGVATDFGDVAGNIFAFFGFVIGSVLVGRLVNRSEKPLLRTAHEALTIQLVVFLLLTVTVGVRDVAAEPPIRYCVCFFLALAMGIQTGVGRHLSIKDVNTTVATMTLHDLAAASRFAGGDSIRWRRRAGVVAALFVGAALGVGFDELVPWGGLGFSSVTVLAVITVMLTVLKADEENRQPQD